ncbi:MAG: methyl-accepting chemotaxis protein [Chitinispirillaceae bacterium]|nr:methyl-accepting chemotaxis protein [Chitinispirillaceae bacterium]
MKFDLKRISISRKISGAVMAILIIFAVGTGVIAYYQALNAMRKELSETVLEMAQDGAMYVQSKLDHMIITAVGIASQSAIQSMDWAQQVPVLESETKRLKFMGMGIINPNGIAQYPDGSTADLKDREYFKKALSGKTAFSDIIISRVTNSPVMMLASPIVAESGDVAAVLLIRLDANWLSEITDRIGLGKDGYSYVIDNKGIMIAHGNREFVTQQRNFIKESKINPEYTRLAEMLQKMIKGESGFDEYSFMGSEKIFGYAPVEGTTWSIAIGAEKREVFRNIYAMQIPIIVFSLILLLFGIVISLVISRSLVRPIQETSTIFKDISEGRGDLTKRLQIKSSDEIGDMARYFNSFIEKLQSTIGTITGNAETVASSAVELSSVSAQIATHAKELDTQTLTVASATEQSTTNFETISSSAEEISISVNSVSFAIEEMSTTLNEVSKNCQKELRIAEEAGGHALTSKNVIDRLSDTTKSIVKIVDLINDIADQTNLLALNATIEAASAGDAGKGFSVVANEVKELAKQTAHATDEIQKQIEGMQSSTESAQIAIEQVTRVIEEVNIISQSIVSTVEEQSVTINEIAKTINNVNNSTLEVARNVAESAKGLSEVSTTIGMVSNVVSDTTRGIMQVNLSADELATLSENLKKLLSQFKI